MLKVGGQPITQQRKPVYSEGFTFFVTQNLPRNGGAVPQGLHIIFMASYIHCGPLSSLQSMVHYQETSQLQFGSLCRSPTGICWSQVINTHMPVCQLQFFCSVVVFCSNQRILYMFFFCEPITVHQFSKARLLLEYWLQVEDQALEASELSRWTSLSPKNLLPAAVSSGSVTTSRK